MEIGDILGELVYGGEMLENSFSTSIDYSAVAGATLAEKPVIKSDAFIKPSVAEYRYKFPAESPDYEEAVIRYIAMSAELLEKNLRQLSVNGSGVAHDPNHYFMNRIDACAISVVLNMKRRFPPFTRSFWKVVSKADAKKWNAYESMMFNDMRVIDLHWLHSNQQLNPLGQWAEMFTPSFDFAWASQYAAELKKSDTKATEFGLPYTHMLSLMTLKSKQVFERHRTIGNYLKRAPSLIKEEMLNPSCRLKSSEKELLDISTALLLSNGNLAVAGQIYTQISGSTITEPTLRKRMHWLLGKKIISFSRTSKI